MKKIFLLSFIFLSPLVFARKTVLYKAIDGDHIEFYQNYTIEELPNGGYNIDLKFMEKNQLNREHIVTLDKNGSTLQWKFYSPITKLSIDAYRKEKEIILTGTKNGKKTEKKFEVGDKAWLQIFPTGLENFALSNSESQIFYSIGIEGPAEMEIGEFIAKHIPSEKADANALSLTFNNWKSTFWKGKSWHRKKDGRILAIQVGRDIGTWELQSDTETK